MRFPVLLMLVPACLLGDVPSVVGQSSVPLRSSQGTRWETLPLTNGNRISKDWQHVGLGGFVVDKGALRTDCKPEGWGLLVYKKKKFGNCQIKVVYRCEHSKANSGVFVRLDKGILKQSKQQPVKRDSKGQLSDKELHKLIETAKAEQGAWYAVSHGFEVQIQDEGPDRYHRTGSIYSFSKAKALPKKKKPTDWRTMLITLQGTEIIVEMDDPREKDGFVTLSRFNSSSRDPRKKREWYEPKWGKRPNRGFIGIQNHDPGDVVYYREISVRALPGKE